MPRAHGEEMLKNQGGKSHGEEVQKIQKKQINKDVHRRGMSGTF